MELKSQITGVILLDSDAINRITTDKCVQYLWAGQVEVCETIKEAQSKLAEPNHAFNLFILSLSDFEDVDLASWLLGIGFKGQLVLMLNDGENAPNFVPCNLLATLKKPVTLHDFNDIFSVNKNQYTQQLVDQKFIFALLNRRDALSIEFQPQYIAKTDTLWGFECLVRFQHKGIRLDTLTVIKAIENFSMMEVFSNVFFKRLAELLPAFKDYRLSINLSLYNIEKYSLFDLMFDFVKNSCMDAYKFTLEFSNEAYFSSSVKAIELLCKFKTHGFQLAIDGYRGDLKSLKGLPLLIDEVKFSALGSSSNAINLSPNNQILIKPLSQNLGTRIVFSGVESYQQVVQAQKIAPASIIQGYYLAPPVSMNDAVLLQEK
ncbi:EAL domain-containing protein [Pseudoalteromonas denitrificans]|uniref:EAL domain, c-di-GMP-specific phosphodiesterase class I (Or its enzymatically inactive variant) n=1 Tax=Pseudoalteromonas denitrificans DSM 6059 TaxID=1123010 RepID=A0A1I1RC10_9GAMM|nr:EAL domain-containing protein [Pseudoalteromonas denitrificans]SFD29073.1 EAL domain, c-di-GMP-specific phosphodiesterase class I (or its enzymatically inactive variant) [Pseudoalteromonas denitrificans DSM 6059]